MKNKLILFLTTFLLLTGCNINKKTSSISSGGNSSSSSSSSSSSISSSSSSEPTPPGPAEYGYDNYGGYYGELKWTDGEDLKNKLNTIIHNGYKPLRYTTSAGANWESNTEADRALYDHEFVNVLYSNQDVFGEYTQSSWQREHAFAASLMTDSGTGDAVKFLGRATDFHNLFAGSSNGNMSRGNKNYGVANPEDPFYQDRTVDGGYDGYSFDEKIFEPGHKDKGRLARAIFYMATMYKDDEYDDVNGKTLKGLRVVEEDVPYVSGNCQFAIGHLSELLEWNNSWNVDLLEMQHNESVYSHVFSKDGYAQGNRNPFVDYPTLVDYIFGDKKDQSGDLKYEKPTSYILKTDTNDFSHYAIANAKRTYSVGETLSSSDFTIRKVYKNFTYTTASSSEYTHSLLNHQFVVEDGETVTATITAGEQTINYVLQIDSDNMQGCSYYSDFDKSGINNTIIGTDQTITRNGTQFIINVTSSSGYTIQNSSKPKGVKMGSKTYPVTSVILTTVNSYTLNSVYVASCAANAESSYSLTIKVGEETVYSGTVSYDANTTSVFGGKFSSKTGKVTYTFTGSSALIIGAVAFNEVS